jgi:hypothetical protein
MITAPTDTNQHNSLWHQTPRTRTKLQRIDIILICVRRRVSEDLLWLLFGRIVFFNTPWQAKSGSAEWYIDANKIILLRFSNSSGENGYVGVAEDEPYGEKSTIGRIIRARIRKRLL